MNHRILLVALNIPKQSNLQCDCKQGGVFSCEIDHTTNARCGLLDASLRFCVEQYKRITATDFAQADSWRVGAERIICL